MPLPSLLTPGGTVFAAVFGGTVGAWLGARLAFLRFKRERAFERRVEWYERMTRCIQEIRSIAWEITANTSKVRPKRYAELSERVAILIRDFQNISAERHVYAKKATLKAIYDLGLSTLQLDRGIPNELADPAASRFWHLRYNEWTTAHQTITADLQDELFWGRPKLIRWTRKDANAKGRPKQIPRQKNSYKGLRKLLVWQKSNRKQLAQAKELPPSAPETSSQSSDADVEDAGLQAIFDTLWATMQVRSRLESDGDPAKIELCNVAQFAILRVADLRSLLAMFNELRDKTRPTNGWQRQHVARLIAFALTENAEQFHLLLNDDFRKNIGADSLRELDLLIRDLRKYRAEYTIKFQSFRNSLVAQRYANANLHIQALRTIPVQEIVQLGYEQMEWFTRLTAVVSSVWNSPRTSGT